MKNKYEHLFEIRASLDENGRIVLRLGKDDNIVIARNVTVGGGFKISNYDFELGSSEFEDDEKILRKQRRAIKELLKEKFGTMNTKIKV